MNILLDTVAILLILITLAPSLPSSHWLVRVWEFPRLQIYLITNIIPTGERPISNVPCAEVVWGDLVP